MSSQVPLVIKQREGRSSSEFPRVNFCSPLRYLSLVDHPCGRR